MRQPDFLSNPNLRRLGIPAVAVAIVTLIFSQGSFLAAFGAGISTAISVYVTNYRLITKVKFLEEKLEDLLGELKRLEEVLASSVVEVETPEPSEPLKEELEDLKNKLRDY